MNWNRFPSQLRREIKANPGKAALLGALLLVALYYWIPLVGKWLGRSTDVELVRAQASPGGSWTPATEKTPPGGAKDAPHPGEVAPGTLSPSGLGSENRTESCPAWDQLVQWRQADPRTRPVQWSAAARDPFQIAPIGSLADSKDRPGGSPLGKTTSKTRSSSSEQLQDPQEPPQQVEVQLTSIVVGPTRRLALINGRLYQEGSTLVLTKDGQQWQFHLSRILPTGIQLQWNDRQYEVSLPRNPSNVEIQTVSTTQTENP